MMILTEVNPVIRELAERLVAFEQGAATILEADLLATCRVCEKLRRPLSHLVGAAGVSSLLRRALALAQRETPALRGVEVMNDGSLKGLEGEAAMKSSLLIAHLINLLVTFIGVGLTFRLLHDIWPEMQGLDEFMGEGGYEQQSQN